jgi:hypothetical protein
MTQNYIVGELSVRLAELQAVATTPQSAQDFVQLRRRVESCPCTSLGCVVRQALTLTDSLCWESLKRGDSGAFDCQASISAELREFGVCAGLIEEGGFF